MPIQQPKEIPSTPYLNIISIENGNKVHKAVGALLNGEICTLQHIQNGAFDEKLLTLKIADILGENNPLDTLDMNLLRPVPNASFNKVAEDGADGIICTGNSVKLNPSLEQSKVLSKNGKLVPLNKKNLEKGLVFLNGDGTQIHVTCVQNGQVQYLSSGVLVCRTDGLDIKPGYSGTPLVQYSLDKNEPSWDDVCCLLSGSDKKNPQIIAIIYLRK